MKFSEYINIQIVNLLIESKYYYARLQSFHHLDKLKKEERGKIC